jgi:RNA polymerase sigma-70 factor (ECF subfamily)
MTSAAIPAARSAGDTHDAREARIRGVVRAHYDPLWRFLRRMGTPEAQVEDAAQQVLLVFANRADDVREDAERPFLFGTALRVAADFRRKEQRGREVADAEAILRHPDPHPSAENLLGQEERRRCLDAILDALTPEHRAVFVLAEIEETTMAEIALLLGLPPGTVASRLRRARELVASKAAELRAKLGAGDAP